MDLNSIVGAAQDRLKELRKELGKLDFLREEEQRLVRLLGGYAGAAISKVRGPKSVGRKAGRRTRNGQPSALALAIEILQNHAGKNGMTVRDVLALMRKEHPGRFTADNASASLSAAFNQGLKGKSSPLRVLKRGGPGKPSIYGAASTVRPVRKAKGKGGGGAKAGAPSKLGLATDVLKKFAGTNGMTVKEILAQLRKSNAALFKGKDASALLSRAFGQAMKAKAPRVKAIKRGGPGRPAKYGAA